MSKPFRIHIINKDFNYVYHKIRRMTSMLQYRRFHSSLLHFKSANSCLWLNPNYENLSERNAFLSSRLAVIGLLHHRHRKQIISAYRDYNPFLSSKTSLILFQIYILSCLVATTWSFFANKVLLLKYRAPMSVFERKSRPTCSLNKSLFFFHQINHPTASTLTQLHCFKNRDYSLPFTVMPIAPSLESPLHNRFHATKPPPRGMQKELLMDPWSFKWRV